MTAKTITNLGRGHHAYERRQRYYLCADTVCYAVGKAGAPSNREIARKTGLTDAAVGKMLNGDTTNPTINSLLLLCDALGIDNPRDLMRRGGEG